MSEIFNGVNFDSDLELIRYLKQNYLAALSREREYEAHISKLKARAAKLENLLDEYNQSVLTPDQRVEQLLLLIVSANRAAELQVTIDAYTSLFQGAGIVMKRDKRQIEYWKARAAELERVLRMVEWTYSDGDGICPWCMGWKEYEGHAPDCPRQKVLGDS